MSEIDHASAYRPRRPDVIDEQFEGEAVVVHLGSGVYYAFNPNASAIWSALAGGRSVAESAAATGAGVEQVAAFYEQLLAENLIEPGVPDAPVEAAPVATTTGDEAPALQRFTDMQDLLMLDPIHDIDLDGTGWPLLPNASS